MKNGDFLKRKAKTPSNYIVEGLVPSNRLVLWASVPGEGKSLIGAYVLYSVAYNAVCFGKKVTPGNVMFIDSENRLNVLQSRASKIRKGLELAGYKQECEVDFQHYTGFLLDNESTWDELLKEIVDLQPCLIMLDHLAQFHNQNEDRAIPMTKVANAITEVMKWSDATFLVMHHFNKVDIGTFLRRLRGSSAIYANCDVACEIRTLSVNNGKLETVGIIPQRRKDITPAPFRVRVNEDDAGSWMQIDFDGKYNPVEDPTMDILAHKIYHFFASNNAPAQVTVNMLRAVSKGFASDTELRNCLKFMERNLGLIDSEKHGHGGAFHYELSPTTTKFRQCPWCNQTLI